MSTLSDLTALKIGRKQRGRESLFRQPSALSVHLIRLVCPVYQSTAISRCLVVDPVKSSENLTEASFVAS
jgi:hypothetical protein